MQRAELHIAGLTTEDELETLRLQLETLNTVTVREAALDRLHLSFDPDKVSANMIEGAANAAGADVVRMNAER